MAVILAVLATGRCAAQEPPRSDDAARSHPRPRVRLSLPPETAPNAASSAAASTSAQSLVIADGTPIHLRFAQPVRGVTRTLVKIKVYSREGDEVRLVASDDVRVNGMVVIPKGARAQATVTNAPVPGLTSGGNFQKGAAIDLLIPKTGTVSLELDWVEDITGKKVLLKAEPTGESKPFVMSVWAEEGGRVVHPAKAKRDMKGLFAGHLRSWAPTGSRLTAFVDGSTGIDPEDAKQAQELLPIPNANGILTIYRTKGRTAERVQISCDEKEITTLGPLQYVSFEVAPGKHTCRVGKQKSAEFNAEAGGQLYLHVRHKQGQPPWELVPVNNEEGEDGTANGAIVEEVNRTETTTTDVPD